MKKTCMLLMCCMMILGLIGTGPIYGASGNNQSERGESTSGELVTIIQLTAKASHIALHTSYTRTVHRQGIKHVVKYVALPKSQCPFCKLP